MGETTTPLITMDTTPRSNDSVETLLKKILTVLDGTQVGAIWGTILGSITDQTDLMELLAQMNTGLFEIVDKLNCSTNPNYPAASKGNVYGVSVAGKIGGASGPAVEMGDVMICWTDSAAGNHATVGANWTITNQNIPGLTALGVALATLANPASDSLLRINSDGTLGYSSLAFNEQTGTTYTLAAADAGKTVRCTNAADIALTIPDNATVPFPLLTTIEIAQGGAGKITIGGAGITIECPAASKRTTAQYAGACLKKRDTNTWWLEGRLE